MGWVGAVGALGWALVWWRLHAVWNAAPEFYFGWAIPPVSVFLFSERWYDRPRPAAPKWIWLLFTGAGTLGVAAFRLPIEAFPQWTSMLWVYTLSMIVLSAGLLGLVGGFPWVRHFIFPIAFSAIALPWPGFVQQAVIQDLMTVLTRLAAAGVTLAGWPARAQGHVIAVAGNLVGVTEACSGVRSLQGVLMVALFLGEFFRFSILRRTALVAAGVALALLANLGRVVFLTVEVARHGPAALDRWHDPAGYVILAFGVGGLTLLGLLWNRRAPAIPPPSIAIDRAPSAPPRWTLAVVAALLLLGEGGTRAWFDWHEYRRAVEPSWTVAWPSAEPHSRPLRISAADRQLLNCNQADGLIWDDTRGRDRAAYFIRWNSGQAGRYLPFLHNPSVCLPAAGAVLLRENPPVLIHAAGFSLPFRALRFADNGRELAIFYCIADLGAGTSTPEQAMTPGWRAWFAAQWRQIREGRRNLRVQLLTVAFWNIDDAQARAALATEVTQLVRSDAPSPG